MQTKTKNAILAFLIAPLGGPLGLYCVYLFQLPLRGIGDSLGLLLVLYLFTTPFIYFFSLILGIPFYLLLRSLNALNRNLLIAGWALIGDLSLLIFSGGRLPERADGYLVLVPFAVGGCAVGLLFWLVIKRGMQDSHSLQG